MGYALRDHNRYTYHDYCQWPEDERYELIDGNAWLMSPAPGVDHQTVAFEVARQVANALEGHSCRVLVAPVDVLLPRGDEADGVVDTVVQPDALVVCDPGKVSRRRVRGAPDWVLEVLSPSSASHDQTRKLAAYERAGVREYWLVHPVDRVLTVYRHDGSAYSRPRIQALSGTTTLEVLPQVAVDWDRITTRLLPDATTEM
ncbi:MAG: Uma2 family endonuclease [Gammaproteobacteria bacterium]|nr:Uma2 family endonuclease [Gammaproteobacteria bacterium]